MANEEDNFFDRKRSRTHSGLGMGTDQGGCFSEANASSGALASRGIMANLATFRCLHQQSGTDALLFYQQTGLFDLEPAASPFWIVLVTSGQ